MTDPTEPCIALPSSTSISALASSEHDSTLKTRLNAWRDEQHRVASQVQVLPDDPSEDTTNTNCRFKTLIYSDYSSSYYYGGVDVSFPDNECDAAVAVYVILRLDTLQVVYRDYEYFHLTVPYVSSFLSFREIEPLERLVKKQLSHRPELTPRAILVDGNGILHARRAGIACFLGVRTGLTTIGVAKTLYCEAGLTKHLVETGLNASLSSLKQELHDDTGWRTRLEQVSSKRILPLLVDRHAIRAHQAANHDSTDVFHRKPILELVADISQGIAVKLMDHDNQVLACALLGHGGGRRGGKTKRNCGTQNPIFISVGHGVSLEEAVQICSALSIFRIPEPVRQADLLGRNLLRSKSQSLAG